MAILLMLGCVVMAVMSLTWPLAFITHAVALVPAVVMLWWVDVTRRPIVPCKRCDRGRDYDRQREHFGERCRGALLGLGSCGGTGKKLRWEAKVISALGSRRLLHNLPDALRGEDA
jgi:hypothetical protein